VPEDGPVAGPAPAPAGPAAAGHETSPDPWARGQARAVSRAEARVPAAAVAPHRLLVVLARALHERPWASSTEHLAAAVWRAAAGPGEAAGPQAGAGPRPALARAAAEPVATSVVAQAAGASSTKPQAQTGPVQPTGDRLPMQAPATQPVAPPAAARPGPAAQGVAPAPTVLSTAYAGLFFVLPLLQRRGLLGDFTQPVPATDSVHPAWLLQALLARHTRRGDGDAQALARLLRGWAGAPRPRRAEGPWRAHLAAQHPLLQADAARALQRPARGTLAWLLRRPGRVRLSATRLDVHFDLASHPLAIRAAGLDRDPGWIPAAGRHVAFHFELP